MSAHAGAPIVWTGTESQLWHDADNWNPAQIPTADDDVEFPQLLDPFVTLDASAVVRSMHFVGLGYQVGTSCSSCSLSTTDGITADSGLTTLGVPLLFATTQTIEVGPSAELSFSAAISGAGGIQKIGAGTLTFVAGESNTYTGDTLVEDGMLSANMPGSVAIPGALKIGTASGPVATAQFIAPNQIADSSHVTVIEQGRLKLYESETIGRLSMTAGTIAPTIPPTGFTLTLGGDVDVTSATVGTPVAASIEGNVSLGNATRTFNITAGPASASVNGDMTIGGDNAGRISGSSGAGIIKTGGGSLRFGGSGAGNANSYPGTTTVNEGTLILDKDDAIAIPGTLQIGDGEGGVDADVVRVVTANQLDHSLIATIASSGLLDVMAPTQSTVESIVLTGGHVKTVGALALTSMSVQASPQQANVEGTLNLVGGPTIFAIADGTEVVDLNLSATLLGVDTLEKTGAGRLELSGDSQNFTGDMAVNEGILRVSSATALGAPSAGTTVSAGAGLEVSGSITIVNENLTLNGLGFALQGALHAIAGNPHWNGTITFASDSVVTVDDGLTLDTNSIAAGGAGLTKSGPGRFNLQGKNWSGGTTIADGTLGLRSISSGSAGLVVVTAGATLEFLLPVVGGGTLSLAGAGVDDNGALRTVSGASNWLGNVVLSGDATVNVANTSSLNVNGSVSGASGIMKKGTGVLILSGNTANTYTGDTRVVQGELDLNKVGFNAIGGDLFVGSSARGNDRGAFVLVKWLRARPEQVINSATATLFADGKLDLTLFIPGHHETICKLINNGGVVDDPTNALIVTNECATVPQSTPGWELFLVLGLALAAVLRVRRTVVQRSGALE